MSVYDRAFKVSGLYLLYVLFMSRISITVLVAGMAQLAKGWIIFGEIFLCPKWDGRWMTSNFYEARLTCERR